MEIEWRLNGDGLTCSCVIMSCAIWEKALKLEMTSELPFSCRERPPDGLHVRGRYRLNDGEMSSGLLGAA